MNGDSLPNENSPDITNHSSLILSIVHVLTLLGGRYVRPQACTKAEWHSMTAETWFQRVEEPSRQYLHVRRQRPLQLTLLPGFRVCWVLDDLGLALSKISELVADADVNRERLDGATIRRRSGTATLGCCIPPQRELFPHSRNYLGNGTNLHPCCLRHYVPTQAQTTCRGSRGI